MSNWSMSHSEAGKQEITWSFSYNAAPFLLQYLCCPAGGSITPQKDQPAWCSSFWWVTSVLHLALSSPFPYPLLSFVFNTSSSSPLLSLLSSLFPFPLLSSPSKGQEGKVSPFTFLLISSCLLLSPSSLLFLLFLLLLVCLRYSFLFLPYRCIY